MNIQIRVHTDKGIQTFAKKVNSPFSIFHEDTGFVENTIKAFVNNFLNKEKLSLQNPTSFMSNIHSISIY